jgi:hypothetical protein
MRGKRKIIWKLWSNSSSKENDIYRFSIVVCAHCPCKFLLSACLFKRKLFACKTSPRKNVKLREENRAPPHPLSWQCAFVCVHTHTQTSFATPAVSILSDHSQKPMSYDMMMITHLIYLCAWQLPKKTSYSQAQKSTIQDRIICCLCQRTQSIFPDSCENVVPLISNDVPTRQLAENEASLTYTPVLFVHMPLSTALLSYSSLSQ